MCFTIEKSERIDMEENKKEQDLTKYSYAFVVWTYCLILLAGAVNVYGIKQLGSTVSHHTGNFSQIAIYSYEKQIPFQFIVVILSFFLGSVTSGIVLAHKTTEGKKAYDKILISGGIALCMMEVLRFQEWAIAVVPFWLGMQNAMFVTYKEAVVRTTHMTGALTDAGFALGSYLRGNTKEIWKVRFYLLSMIVFVVGGYFGNFLVGYSTFPLSFVGVMYSVIGLWYMNMEEFSFEECLSWLFTLEVTPYESIVWIFKDDKEAN